MYSKNVQVSRSEMVRSLLSQKPHAIIFGENSVILGPY